MALKKPLGQILIEAGVIDEYQLKSALGYQKQWGGRLGKVLVENRFITEEALVEAIHSQTGIEVVKLDGLEIADHVIQLVPVGLAERHQMIPVRLEGEAGKPGETIVLAMADPTNLSAQDEVQFRTGKKVTGVLAGESSITGAIRCYYHRESAEEPFAADTPLDPEKIQFAGVELSAEDMVSPEMRVVRGTLESASDVVDAAFKGGFGLGGSAPPPPPAGGQDPSLQESSEEDDLPEVEIVEDFEVEEEQVEEEPLQQSKPESDPAAAAQPVSQPAEEPVTKAGPVSEPSRPATPPRITDGEAFGVSGDLLGSPLTASKPDEPEQETANPARASTGGLEAHPRPFTWKPASPKQKPETPKHAKASDLDDLLSSLEAKADRTKAPAPPARRTPPTGVKPLTHSAIREVPPMADRELAKEVQQLLDSLESTKIDGEPPMVAKANHLISAVIRLLMKKEVFTDTELLDELRRR